MNCTTCNTPHAPHELYSGLCLKCLGKERDEISLRLRTEQQKLYAADAALAEVQQTLRDYRDTMETLLTHATCQQKDAERKLAAALVRIGELERALKPAEPQTPTVSDGFGNEWSAICPMCQKKSIEVVRPGKVQCRNCDSGQEVSLGYIPETR